MSDDAPAPAKITAPAAGIAAAAADRDGRLFDSLHEGVWERDLRTDEVWYSPRYKELLGFTDAELPDEREALRDRLHPDDQAVVAEIYAAAEARIGSGEAQVRLRMKGGGWRWFRGRVRVWPDLGDRPAVLVGAICDVHEQVLAHQALEAQSAALEARVRERTQGLEDALRQAEAERLAAERASRAKASFLAHMGHELRTPLNGMLGMNQLALPLALGHEQRRYLELAQQSGLALQHLLDDVLDFARADAGQLQLHDEPFDLAQLAAETLRSSLPETHARGLQVGFDYVGGITLVHGDPGRVRQIVSSLVGNAVRFTERGEVVLTVAVEAGEPGACNVLVAVQDTGIGMDEATAQRIFDPFEQGDSGIARRHGGTGLGLSMVRLLAGLMGGRVSVKSRPGVGSVFEVGLQLVVRDEQPLAALAAAHTAPGHAWLVGRGGVSGRFIQARLERIGWSSELLSGIDAAIDELRIRGPRGAPGCIAIGGSALTPGADFPELYDRLPPGVPVTLLLRPDFDLQTVQSAAERPRVQVMIAPITAADLYALVRRGVGPARAEPAPGVMPKPNVLVVEDNPINQIIAVEMVVALGMTALVVCNGEEAVTSCQQAAPALVLMDIQMPGMDGLETTRRLRRLQAEGRLQHFPIIALTSHAMPSDRDASLEAGMDEHLSKPIQLDRLRRVIEHWLATAQAQ
jgi:PAS domain S-box-containing protein